MPLAPLHILVVEDHESSRELLCEMLSVLDNSSHCVATAEEAIEPLKSGKFNVLIADISLPGMSGIALAEMAAKIVPGLKIIFASGYAYLVTDKTDFQFTLLPKPFDLAQLRHALSVR